MPSKNVYVAAKWEDRTRAREIMQLLEQHGWTITHDWTHNEEVSADAALHDLDGVLNADALVFVAEQDLNYRGALVEVGVALGLDIPVYVIGRGLDRCIFSKLPQITYGIDSLLQ